MGLFLIVFSLSLYCFYRYFFLIEEFSTSSPAGPELLSDFDAKVREVVAESRHRFYGTSGRYGYRFNLYAAAVL
jgi:hypothetical protein